MRIGIMGGYGFNNAGDEAQLRACISEIKKHNKTADLVVFSPNPQYTSDTHDVHSIPSSRTNVFYEKIFPFYSCSFDLRLKSVKSVIKCTFLIPMFIIGFFLVFSALLHKNTRTCILFRSFLHELSRLDHLHFSGGGYFTGKTCSRLIDFSFIMICCRIYSIPVTMSGQTIGLWPKWISPFLAFAFKAVSSVSVRDGDYSRSWIEKISNIKVDFTCDDAYGIYKGDDEETSKAYHILHFHSWSDNSDIYKLKIFQFFSEIVECLGKEKVILVSMTPTDDKWLTEFSKEFDVAISSANDPLEYKLLIFRNCLSVITMKHHPIIFGLSFSKPVISFFDTEYYEQKNSGAYLCHSCENNNFAVEDFDSSQINTILKNINICSTEVKENQRTEWFKNVFAII